MTDRDPTPEKIAQHEAFITAYERRWPFPGRGDRVEALAWWEMIEGWNPDWFPELMDRVQAMRDTNQGFPRREVVEQAWRILVAQKSTERPKDDGPVMTCREFLLWLEEHPDEMPEEGSKTVGAWRRRLGLDPPEETPPGTEPSKIIDDSFDFGFLEKPAGAPVSPVDEPESVAASEDLFADDVPSASSTEPETPKMPEAPTGPLGEDEETPW
jgi:hypothetical protein